MRFIFTNMADVDLVYKVLLIGDAGTGKTSMLKRYTEDQFTNSYVSSVGIDFNSKTVMLHEKNVKLQIWDCAGDPRYRNITTSFYRGTYAIFIVYDVTNRSSFENVQNWLKEIETYCTDGVKKVLVGNKSDLLWKRCVTEVEAKSLAERNQMEYVETSAKENTNLNKAFVDSLYEAIYSKLKTQEEKKGNTLSPMNVNPNPTYDTNKQKDFKKQKEAARADLRKYFGSGPGEGEVPYWAKDMIKNLELVVEKLEEVDILESTVDKVREKIEVLESKVNNLEQKKG